MHMSNCIIAQSGGPTAAINASLAGVIEAAIESSKIEKIYGSINGIEGVFKNQVIDLGNFFSDYPEDLDTLKKTPAMYLGSCRYKLPEYDKAPEVYDNLFQFFNKLNISYFFYIGGNDSMDTVLKLSQHAKRIESSIRFIGIPKTIDNDLPGTDHTPGFGSAAKFIATAILEIAHDTYIYDLQSVTIVEIMGRNAGWLTAASALARTTYSNAPDLIYLPEVSFSKDLFLQDIKQLQKTKRHIIIAVSEGIKDSNGQYIAAAEAKSKTDQFGHAQLSGVAKTLEAIVSNEIGCKVRSIEISTLQRSAMHSGSLTDINEAVLVGRTAVKKAEENQTGIMMTIVRTIDSPYTVEFKSDLIENVANKEKCVPLEWITESKNDVRSELIDYVFPLIQGEPSLTYKNGIPNFLSIKNASKYMI
ncbi:MAG: 6-phosphofructokinase [Firmicutes bacterium HGW-Firmicutes-7]|nr:MAG: 6-phosphofructokinase [Firmicutes bacterium HGW-Firmicutes-7]